MVGLPVEGVDRPEHLGQAALLEPAAAVGAQRAVGGAEQADRPLGLDRERADRAVDLARELVGAGVAQVGVADRVAADQEAGVELAAEQVAAGRAVLARDALGDDGDERFAWTNGLRQDVIAYA